MKTKKSLIPLGVILVFFSTTALSHAISLTSITEITVSYVANSFFDAGDEGALSSTDLIPNDTIMATPTSLSSGTTTFSMSGTQGYSTSGGFIDTFQNATNSFTVTEEFSASVDGGIITQPKLDVLQCDTPAPAAPVPEPATMLLFGTGLAGLAGTRLRKKFKK